MIQRKYAQRASSIRPRPSRRAVAVFVLLIVAGLSTACDSLLDVELPGAVTEGDLLSPSLAETAVLSAMADYECAYAEFAAAIGGMEDSYWESTGWFTRAWSEYRVDRTNGAINTTPCGVFDTGAGFFTNFQASRFQAEQAYDNIGAFDADAMDAAEKEKLLARAAVIAGLNYGTFGEHWCSMAVNVGEEMTPQQTLQLGEEWYNRAIQHLSGTGDFSTANASSLEQLAFLGRARVRYALGDMTGAAADAAQVESGFGAWVTRSSSTRKRWNQVYQHLTVSKYGTVPPQVEFMGAMVPFTGYRDLTIADDGRAIGADGTPVSGVGTADTRVPVTNTGQLGQDGVTPHWVQGKYGSHGDAIPLAKWEEAVLIQASVEGGQGAIDHVNTLRDAHGLPQVTYLDASDTQGILDMLLEERRRTFFFEGRWHADKLRNDLWFPRGLGFNHKGVAYGEATCLELAEAERQVNPNLQGT